MRETIQNANGKQFHAVSLSGGKDSSAMLLLMIERGMPIDMVLSADTGMEFPEMYAHLAKLDEHLFRKRGIHITTLRHPKGFEFLMFDEPKQKPRSMENRAKLGIPPYGNGWPGIRVDEDALDRQLTIAGCDDRRELPFQKAILNKELPYTIGGGIGQSRICMFFLRKAHIGEVHASLWPEEVMKEAAAKGVQLL